MRPSFYAGLVLGGLLAPTAGAAQTVSLGTLGGITRSSQAQLDPASVPPGLTGRWAPTFGLLSSIGLSRYLDISLEANYVLKGYWARSYAVNIDYLEVPLLLNVAPLGPRRIAPIVSAGASAGLKLKCSVADHRISIAQILYPPGHECAGRQTKRWDRSVVGGLGVAATASPFTLLIQLRFARAWTNFYDPGGGAPSYNQTMAVLTGLTWKL